LLRSTKKLSVLALFAIGCVLTNKLTFPGGVAGGMEHKANLVQFSARRKEERRETNMCYHGCKRTRGIKQIIYFGTKIAWGD
jgi:hypothetical protein